MTFVIFIKLFIYAFIPLFVYLSILSFFVFQFTVVQNYYKILSTKIKTRLSVNEN